jgi:hypothetical protein
MFVDGVQKTRPMSDLRDNARKMMRDAFIALTNILEFNDEDIPDNIRYEYIMAVLKVSMMMPGFKGTIAECLEVLQRPTDDQLDVALTQVMSQNPFTTGVLAGQGITPSNVSV